MTQLAPYVLLFPLLGFLYCAIIGHRTTRTLAGVVASVAVGASFVCALGVLLGNMGAADADKVRTVTLLPWITSGTLQVSWSLLIDPLSALMITTVTGVAFLIHVYATAYMKDHHGHLDEGYNRFFAFLNLFVLAMLILVLADNFAMLMVGWGGVGVCSYFLIAFWFQKPENASAGVKAFVVNAIGDVGLFLACFLTFWTYGRLDYAGVFSAVQAGRGDQSVPLIAVFLLIAAIAKSAQLPLHVWLPDAMAGPTPVSALIHAATMVTAGVYLIARAHPIFEHAPQVMLVTAILGTVTAIFAASIALVQTNLKRIIAYSTLSQLGYMFAGVGVGAFGASIFHLTTHAFFKALLFLAAGIVIHELANNEELRVMGGLRKRMPLVWACFTIGALANAGIVPFAGFFSKDEIVGAAFAVNPILGLVLILTSGLTGFYMFRAVFLTFHGEPSIDQIGLVDPHGHGPASAMTIPVLLLAIPSVVAGLLFSWFEGHLKPVFERFGGHPAHPPGPFEPIAIVTLIVSLLGIAVAYRFYMQDRSLPARLSAALPMAHAILRNAYFVDTIYGLIVVAPGRILAVALSGPIDRGAIDALVGGVGGTVRWIASELSAMQTGFVRNYALGILIGVVVIVGYLMRIGA
jgi:NADH-quinone oxidoreductase subunit L